MGRGIHSQSARWVRGKRWSFHVKWPPWGPRGHQGVVGDHHQMPIPSARQRAVQRLQHLCLGIRFTARRGMDRLGLGVQPPLGVQRHEAQLRPGIHHAGTGTTIGGQDLRPVGLDEATLLPDAVPAGGMASIPVVVPRDEDQPSPGLPPDGDLGLEDVLAALPVRRPLRRQAVLVHVVPEKHHQGTVGPFGGGLGDAGEHQVAGQGPSGVPDQNESGLDIIGAAGARGNGRYGGVNLRTGSTANRQPGNEYSDFVFQRQPLSLRAPYEKRSPRPRVN